MKRILLIILASASAFSLFQVLAKNGEAQLIKLAYCPTMAAYAESLPADQFQIMLVENSAKAMTLLSNEQIDLALIGRKALAQEKKATTKELAFNSAYTLISQEGSWIDEEELANLIIHTAVDQALVSELLPQVSEIYFYDTTKEAVENGLDEVVLIAWDDYLDDYGLVVPMRGEKKVADFRSPFVYYQSVNQEAANLLENNINWDAKI